MRDFQCFGLSTFVQRGSCNRIQIYFLWGTWQGQLDFMLLDMFFFQALYLPVEYFENHPHPYPSL